jgi:hypothetical protein
MSKVCCKCKELQPIDLFGKLKSSPNGLRYDCKDCRKKYRESNSVAIREKLNEYYYANKDELLAKNKEYRLAHKDSISEQRKEYRNREEVKAHKKQKQKEYLPIRKQRIAERRKTDLDFQIKEVLRSKIHKFLKAQPTSYVNLIRCDLEFFKKWIEFRFDDNMTWKNFGKVWQIDHIIPINSFDMSNPNDIQICFHWTNLQPLGSYENRQKSDKIIPHYYFNNIVNVFRFCKTDYSGCQVLNESLKWLRCKLRYGENPPYDVASENATEIDNQQPSL